MLQNFTDITVLWLVISSAWLLVVSAGYRLAAPQWVTFAASALLVAPLAGILIMGSPSKSIESVQTEQKTLALSCTVLRGGQ